MKVYGHELMLGSVVDLWFNHRAIVLSMKSYNGPLKNLFPMGAKIIKFSFHTKK